MGKQSKYISMNGQRHGRLVVIKRVENNPRSKHPRLLCKCDCEKEKIIYATNLRKGVTRSCGCEQKEIVSVFQRRKIAEEEGYKGRISMVKSMTDENEKIRNSKEYKWWRISVLERDNFTCIECGDSDSELHVHHIKSFVNYFNLILDSSNGATLCVHCHAKKHRWNKPLQIRSEQLKLKNTA